MSGLSVFIATPCYGPIAATHYTSLIENMAHAGIHGVAVGLSTMSRDSFITNVRNRLVMNFLESDATHLFFWDADIQAYHPDYLYRLVRSGLDVVGGVYVKKDMYWDSVHTAVKNGSTHEQLEFATSPLAYNPKPIETRDNVELYGDLFIEVNDLPCGFTAYSRNCIEKMIEAYPETKYITKDKTTYALFDFFRNEKLQPVTEDYYFCRRWRDIGGQVYALSGCDLIHWGSYGYRGVLR